MSKDKGLLKLPKITFRKKSSKRKIEVVAINVVLSWNKWYVCLVCFTKCTLEMIFQPSPIVWRHFSNFGWFRRLGSKSVVLCQEIGVTSSGLIGEELVQLCLVSLTVLCVFFQTAGGKQEAKESSIVVVLPLVVFQCS